METWWRNGLYRPYLQRNLSRSQCGGVGLFREVLQQQEIQSDVESKQAAESRCNVIRLIIRSSIIQLNMPHGPYGAAFRELTLSW